MSINWKIALAALAVATAVPAIAAPYRERGPMGYDRQATPGDVIGDVFNGATFGLVNPYGYNNHHWQQGRYTGGSENSYYGGSNYQYGGHDRLHNGVANF